MFFTKATASGTAGSAPASDAGGNGGAVPSSSSAAARSGEIRARHGASYATAAVIPSSYSNQNDGEDGDGGRRAGGGSSSASSSLGNDPDNAAPGAHSRLLFSRLAAAASPLLGTGSGALLTALVCLCWMGVSSLLILLNKHLLATGFHYPMALSCLGMLFSSVAAFFCCRVTNLVEARRNAFSPREYLTKVVPVGLLMALTLHFGNVVYLYLTVSFIQMLKAFTPVVTMAALFAAGLEKPCRDLVGAVAAIAGGTALASAGEVNLSLTGVACMAASEAFEAARLVLTQTLLAAGGPRSLGPIEGLLYLAPACSAWLLAGSAVLELPAMRREGALELVMERPLLFLAAAAMGFACNALAYGVIRRAGSLTLKVLGTVKNVAVVGAGMALFGDRVALLQAVGYAVSIGGFVSYQRVKAGAGGVGSGNGNAAVSEKEAAAAASGSEGAGSINKNKIEAVSSFIVKAPPTAAEGEHSDIATAADLSSEKRPLLLPTSFVPALAAHDSTSSLSSSAAPAVSSASASASADSAPLSTVDAIAAKLSGFFSFGATAPSSSGEIAAGRV